MVFNHFDRESYIDICVCDILYRIFSGICSDMDIPSDILSGIVT